MAQDQAQSDPLTGQPYEPTAGGMQPAEEGIKQDDQAKEDQKKREEEQKDKGWQSVNSSNISAFKYVSKSRDLTIAFHGGRNYTYHAVDEDVANGLGEAGSPGKYFWSSIRNKYAFTKGGRYG